MIYTYQAVANFFATDKWNQPPKIVNTQCVIVFFYRAIAKSMIGVTSIKNHVLLAAVLLAHIEPKLRKKCIFVCMYQLLFWHPNFRTFCEVFQADITISGARSHWCWQPEKSHFLASSHFVRNGADQGKYISVCLEG